MRKNIYKEDIVQIPIYEVYHHNDIDKETRIWQGPKPLKKDAAQRSNPP